MNIGKNILQQRKKKNVTQEELAAELGVTAAAVSKWENGYTLPDIMMLCALADYFEVTTDELLGRFNKWKYAVIAAETEELGKRIAALAKAYGIAPQGIYTDYSEAVKAAEQDDTISQVIAGFYHGWYGGTSSANVLVSVHPTDDEILYALQLIFENMQDNHGRHIIIS